MFHRLLLIFLCPVHINNNLNISLFRMFTFHKYEVLDEITSWVKSQNIFYEWLPQTEEVLLLNSAVRGITPSDRTYYDNVVYILTQRQIFGSDALRWTEFRLNEAVDSTKCSYSYWLKFLSSFTCLLFIHIFWPQNHWKKWFSQRIFCSENS